MVNYRKKLKDSLDEVKFGFYCLTKRIRGNQNLKNFRDTVGFYILNFPLTPDNKKISTNRKSYNVFQQTC